MHMLKLVGEYIAGTLPGPSRLGLQSQQHDLSRMSPQAAASPAADARHVSQDGSNVITNDLFQSTDWAAEHRAPTQVGLMAI